MSAIDRTVDLASRAAHMAGLRDLGFPEYVAQEAVSAHESGLFSMQPPADLLRRTIDQCEDVLAAPAVAARPEALAAWHDISEVLAAYYMAVTDLDGALESLKMGHWPSHASRSFGYLAGECLAAAGFAKETGQRPMMLVDNHNLIDPDWWLSDSWFSEVSDQFAAVNHAARTVLAPPSAVVMVLRPSLDDYDHRALQALAKLLDETSSDVWIMSEGQAGAYGKQDVFVFGDERAMMLAERCSTPSAAFRSFREMSASPVREIRAGIEALTKQATDSCASRGTFSKCHDDVRGLLGSVIDGGQAMRLMQSDSLAVT